MAMQIFPLKWNKFQNSVNAAFGRLREDNDFTNVTLVCEDGQLMEAHKVILAASSPFFDHLLRMTKQAHPLVYMRGVTAEVLSPIIDFLYSGEANVQQEHLDSFLSLALELNLEGLKEQHYDEAKEDEVDIKSLKTNLKPSLKRRKKFSPKAERSRQHDNDSSPKNDETASGIFEEMDTEIDSLTEKTEKLMSNGKKRAYSSICKQCGKEGPIDYIKNHIAVNHTAQTKLTCNQCKTTFDSRATLEDHNSRYHEDQENVSGEVNQTVH